MAANDTFKIHRHPQLVEDQESHVGIDDFVRGKKKYVDKYLQMYSTELEDSAAARRAFQNRKARSYNKNLCKPILKTHAPNLAQKLNLSGTDSERMSAIVEDITGYGVSIARFRSQCAWEMLKHGILGVLVEGPALIAADRQTAQELRERSYSILYRVSEIFYWRFVESGPRKGEIGDVILYADAVKDKTTGKTVRMFDRYFLGLIDESENADLTVIHQKLIEDGNSIGERDTKVRVVGETALAIDQVPFVLIGEGVKKSVLDDVWQLNAAHFNQQSLLTNVNYKQGFRVPIISGDIDTSLIAKGISESTWLAFRGTNVSVDMIDEGEPTSIEAELHRLERFIRDVGVMMITRQVSDDTRQEQGAASKQLDMSTRIEYYSELLDELAQAFTKILRLHSQYEGEGPDDNIEATFAKDFAIDDREQVVLERTATNAAARELSVIKVQGEVLKSYIAEMEIVPAEGKSLEETREELMAAVDAAVIAFSPDDGSANNNNGQTRRRQPDDGTISLDDLL